MTALQSEVFTALITQGFPRKEAKLKLANARGEDFPSMFQSAINAPAIESEHDVHDVHHVNNVVPIREEKQPKTRLGKAWRFLRSLDRDAAIDSARTVLACIGGAAILAYMGTMPPVLVPLALVIVIGLWYADYLRHF